jgi:hypothetical protein
MIPVITFYTPEYQTEAKELGKTCAAFGLNFKAYEKPSKGSWVVNCTMKADVILEALEEFQTGVVWIDADGRIRSFPFLFNNLKDFDFGCYWIPNVWNKLNNVRLKPWNRGNEALAGGTMYFNNTEKSYDLITKWKKESSENPTRWEQQSLQKVWEECDDNGLRTYNFPQGYCKVFDCKWFENPGEIVVEHMQASRKLKRVVK